MIIDASPHLRLPENISLRRRRVLQAGLAGSLCGPLAACGDSGSGTNGGNSTDYAATIHDGQTAITQAMADTETSSVSIALLDKEQIVWQQAFGTIDDANHQPASLNTLYNIGSVSKVFVAMAVMILVDRDLVDLDAPAANYIRGFQMRSPEFTHITVRMLLSHSSGFPGANYNNIFSFEALPGYARHTQAVLAGQHLKHVPGEMAVYCNDGFTLAERVVEEVSGKSYAVFVAQEILAPLQMTLSRYPLAHYPAGSFAHARFRGVDQPQEFVNAHGTGGLSSTPTEMMNLAMMFLQEGEFKGQRILSRESIAEMGHDQTGNLTLNPAPIWKWGLGWDHTDHPALQAVGFACWEKNGGTAFFGSDFFVMPGTGLALMITGTSLAYGAAALAERILLHALLDKGHLQRLPKAMSPDAAVAAADPVALAAIEGDYGSVEGVSRISKNPDGSITLSSYGAGQWNPVTAKLTQREDGWFSAADTPRSYRSTDSGPFRYLMVRFAGGNGHYWNFIPYGQQIRPASALPAAWRARLGKHWILVNEHESSTMLDVDSPQVTLTEIETLPGYLQIDGLQPLLPDTDDRTRQFLKVPVNQGRDLYELTVQQRSNGEWLIFGGYHYQPQDAIVAVTLGSHIITIDAQGYSQCLKLGGATTLDVSGARAWRLYDSQWKPLKLVQGPGHTTLPGMQEFFVMIYGEPTSQAHITLT